MALGGSHIPVARSRSNIGSRRRVEPVSAAAHEQVFRRTRRGLRREAVVSMVIVGQREMRRWDGDVVGVIVGDHDQHVVVVSVVGSGGGGGGGGGWQHGHMKGQVDEAAGGGGGMVSGRTVFGELILDNFFLLGAVDIGLTSSLSSTSSPVTSNLRFLLGPRAPLREPLVGMREALPEMPWARIRRSYRLALAGQHNRSAGSHKKGVERLWVSEGGSMFG